MMGNESLSRPHSFVSANVYPNKQIYYKNVYPVKQIECSVICSLFTFGILFSYNRILFLPQTSQSLCFLFFYFTFPREQSAFKFCHIISASCKSLGSDLALSATSAIYGDRA